jgi:hypothetical protein
MKSIRVDPIAPTLRIAKRSPAPSNLMWVRAIGARSRAEGVLEAFVVDREQRRMPMF